MEIIHFQPPRDGWPLQTMDRKHGPQRTSSCGKIASKSGQRSKPFGWKYEISIKISTDSYSVAPRKPSFCQFCPFSVSVRFLQTTPLTATLHWGVWLASTSEMWTTSQQRTRILPPMSRYSEVQLYVVHSDAPGGDIPGSTPSLYLIMAITNVCMLETPFVDG